MRVKVDWTIRSKGHPLSAYSRKQGGVNLKAKFVQLHHIEHDGPVTAERCGLFWHALHTGLLLALQEHKVLDDETCRNALESMEKHTRRKGKQ